MLDHLQYLAPPACRPHKEYLPPLRVVPFCSIACPARKMPLLSATAIATMCKHPIWTTGPRNSVRVANPPHPHPSSATPTHHLSHQFTATPISHLPHPLTICHTHSSSATPTHHLPRPLTICHTHSPSATPTHHLPHLQNVVLGHAAHHPRLIVVPGEVGDLCSVSSMDELDNRKQQVYCRAEHKLLPATQTPDHQR